jgi:hypothetical protein
VDEKMSKKQHAPSIRSIEEVKLEIFVDDPIAYDMLVRRVTT